MATSDALTVTVHLDGEIQKALGALRHDLDEAIAQYTEARDIIADLAAELPDHRRIAELHVRAMRWLEEHPAIDESAPTKGH